MTAAERTEQDGQANKLISQTTINGLSRLAPSVHSEVSWDGWTDRCYHIAWCAVGSSREWQSRLSDNSDPCFKLIASGLSAFWGED